MFHDVHEKLGVGMAEQRIPGGTFDEVMYADDTICIGTDTRKINQMLEAIEVEGENAD